MSRCFPFLPPGYDKKARTESSDLLTKEKHKDKKHKKEKRDKEKREHKEKKDKDRSKDENGKKKDQKEKRRDKRKDKDWDKGRTSKNRRAEDQTECHNELRGGERSHKTNGSKGSKFKDEFGRGIRDDETGQAVASFTSPMQRNIERMNSACTRMEKRIFTNSKVFPGQIVAAQRTNGVGMLLENGISGVIDEERGKMCDKVIVSTCSKQNRNHGISRPMDHMPAMVHRKAESSGIAGGKEMGKLDGKFVVSNSISSRMKRVKLSAKILPSNFINATQRRNEILGQTVERIASIHKKTEGMGASSFHSRIKTMATVPAVGKERVKSNEMFLYPVESEKRRTNTIGQLLEKDHYQKVGRKDEIEVRVPEDRKEGHMDRDHTKNDEGNYNNSHSKKKKKEENILDKTKSTTSEKLRNIVKNYEVDTLVIKPLAPHKDNRIGTIADTTLKKRKDIETNGYLQENDARPSRILRMTTSQPLVLGRTLGSPLCAPPVPSLNDGAINNLRPDRFLKNRESKIYSTAKSQHYTVDEKPLVKGDHFEDCKVPLISPHPDSKYLSQIYMVPQKVENPESDDQEWLISSNPLQEAMPIEVPQVCAEAVQIESADIFALPYVIIF